MRATRSYEKVAEYLRTANRDHYCWVCGRNQSLEWAHISGREWDCRISGKVHPHDIAVLCNDFMNGCHQRYDRHELDLVPYLAQEHIDRAVEILGAQGAAIRLRGSRNPDPLPGWPLGLGDRPLD